MKRLIIIGCWLTLSINAWAQKLDNEPMIPMLNGHKVLTLEEAKSPFTNSNFGLTLGIGETVDFTSLSLIYEDSTITNINNKLNYLNLSVDYQQQIKDWIAMYILISLNMRMGDDVESLVLTGLDRITTTETGWIFKLMKKEKSLLSGNFWMRNTQATYIDIPGYVRDLIKGVDYLSVSKSVPVLVFGGGLLYAHAFNQTVGLTAESQIVYGETLVRGEDKFQYLLGGSFDFDLQHVINIPFSLVVGGRINTISDVYSLDGSILSVFNGKFSYTGSSDYNFGVEFYDGFTPVDDNNKRVRVTGLGLNVNMFF